MRSQGWNLRWLFHWFSLSSVREIRTVDSSRNAWAMWIAIEVFRQNEESKWKDEEQTLEKSKRHKGRSISQFIFFSASYPVRRVPPSFHTRTDLLIDDDYDAGYGSRRAAYDYYLGRPQLSITKQFYPVIFGWSMICRTSIKWSQLRGIRWPPTTAGSTLLDCLSSLWSSNRNEAHITDYPIPSIEQACPFIREHFPTLLKGACGLDSVRLFSEAIALKSYPPNVNEKKLGANAFHGLEEGQPDQRLNNFMVHSWDKHSSVTYEIDQFKGSTGYHSLRDLCIHPDREFGYIVEKYILKNSKILE